MGPLFAVSVSLSLCKALSHEWIERLASYWGGFVQVLSALDELCKFAGERSRFQIIVADLARDTHIGTVDMDCKTAALALINAIICAGPGRDSVTFRMHLRHEFLMLGVDPCIDTLRRFESPDLEKHVRIFDDV